MDEIIFRDLAYYQPGRDGTLEEYLTEKDGCTTFPLFHGYNWYETLWEREYLRPGSIIRLMYNFVGGDEHYGILERHKLQGIGIGGAHAGKEGIFDPRVILTDKSPNWEAQHLNIRKIQEDYEKLNNTC